MIDNSNKRKGGDAMIGLTEGLLVFLALFFTVLGVAMLKDTSFLSTLVKELGKSTAHRLNYAILPLVIGAGLLPFHYLWVTVSEQIVTIVLMLFFLSGVFRMIFLDTYHKIGERVMKNKQIVLLITLIYLALGVYMLYLGLL